jgi:hypothetical protein
VGTFQEYNNTKAKEKASILSDLWGQTPFWFFALSISPVYFYIKIKNQNLK